MEDKVVKEQSTSYSDRQAKLYFRILLVIIRIFFKILLHGWFRWCPITHQNRAVIENLRREGKNFILSCWHGSMYYCSWPVYNMNLAVMASRSNVGSAAAAMLLASKNVPVRGGSRKGGREALAEMQEYMKTGKSTAIIADAPRGPAYESKIGPILLAQRTQAPIISISIAAKRSWHFKGWDHAWLPKPFNPVIVVWGEPFFVPAEADREKLEEARRELTKSMNDLQKIADHHFKSRQNSR